MLILNFSKILKFSSTKALASVLSFSIFRVVRNLVWITLLSMNMLCIFSNLNLYRVAVENFLLDMYNFNILSMFKKLFIVRGFHRDIFLLLKHVYAEVR